MAEGRVHIINIDSRNRDFRRHPRACLYSMDLPEVLRDVVSVALVFAVYEKFGSEYYCHLSIAELDPAVVTPCSTCNAVHNGFTQLPLLDERINVFAGQYRAERTFAQPLAKLHRLSFRFLVRDGKLAPFKDHIMRFEVRCAPAQPPASTQAETQAPTPDPQARELARELRALSRQVAALSQLLLLSQQQQQQLQQVGGVEQEKEEQEQPAADAQRRRLRAVALVAGVGGAAYAAYRFRGRLPGLGRMR